MQKGEKAKPLQPPQTQRKQPGIEAKMDPQPEFMGKTEGARRLEGKVAIVTGGDSGIGRAVAVAFAKEGASVAISYLDETQDAEKTQQVVEEMGQRCVLIPGDLSAEKHCQYIIERTLKEFGRLDILVNNAAVQYPQKSIEEVTAEQLQKTFATNIFSHFYLCRFAMPHLKKGSSIICTTSVTAYRGSKELLDYSATKGAIVSLVRSLSASVADKGIRVNGVAPGPIWTPLIPASFDAKKVSMFGSDTPLGRAGQPEEVASCYVFLASDDASYMTGQILHPNGGEIVNA